MPSVFEEQLAAKLADLQMEVTAMHVAGLLRLQQGDVFFCSNVPIVESVALQSPAPPAVSSEDDKSLNFGGIDMDQDIAENARLQQTAVSEPGSLHEVLHAISDEFQFALHKEWHQDKQKSQPSRIQPLSRSNVSTSALWVDQEAWGDAVSSETICSMLIQHPDGNLHLGWVFMCCLLIVYDVVLFPMVMFDEFPTVTLEAALFIAAWWTVDVGLQFLTGYHNNGLIEMRPLRIAKNYVKHGLCVDVPMVLVDWLTLVVELALQKKAAEGSEVARLGRGLRGLRFIRAFRLVRLYRMAELISNIVDRLPSSNLVAGVRMSSVIAIVVLVCHYIACFWYGLAAWYVDEDVDTWTKSMNVADEDAYYLYSLALHWALTQFCPAPTDVKPANVLERSFANVIVLFALIVSSSFIGSISAKITEIRNLRNKQFTDEALVREYLAYRRVSLNVGLRVWEFLRNEKLAERRRLHESDIGILQGIPTSLRSALRSDVHTPVVREHPLFQQLMLSNPYFVEQLCYRGMNIMFYKPSQDVFVNGGLAENAYFIASGELRYQTTLRDRDENLGLGGGRIAWVSEVVLWGPWRHCGQLTASISAEILALCAATFREIGTESDDVDASHRHALRRYATAFALLVRPIGEGEDEEPLVTDIDASSKVRGLVQEVFNDVATFDQIFVNKDSSRKTLATLSRALTGSRGRGA